jgi:geranylgeranyl diphosphate synthase, type I
MTDISQSEMLEAIEVELQRSLLFLNQGQSEFLGEMIAYHMGWTENNTMQSGKRIRPLLTLLSCGAAGGNWRSALPAAAAVELLHNFSLLHDDIEDQSDTRRGRETVWKRWGIAQAINTGDAVFILSRMALNHLDEHNLPTTRMIEVIRMLDLAALKLSEGQHHDIAFENQPEVSLEAYLSMIEGKTASLLSAATRSGAVIAAGEGAQVDAMQRFGRHLGLAFQIQDDILGIWGSPEITGKPAGDDLRSRKKTLPAIFGLENSLEFSSYWKRPMVDDATIAEMTLLLEKIGALQYARENASKHTAAALEAIETGNLTQPYLDQIREITNKLLQRKN